jgi:hypothetical protein
VQLEGLGQFKNLMTSLGVEPTTFQLVSQCLNQLHYRIYVNAHSKHHTKFLLSLQARRIRRAQVMDHRVQCLILNVTVLTINKSYVLPLILRPFYFLPELCHLFCCASLLSGHSSIILYLGWPKVV